MKKTLPFILLFSSLLLFIFIGIQSGPTEDTQETAKKISGAYEALNFIGARQTYPFNKIPNKAHFAAWERWQADNISMRSNDPLPWESLGPHNRGGRTLAIALNPLNTRTIYAGSASGGLWKSTTEGVGAEAWQLVETGFPVLGVSTIAIHPTDTMVMYIGTGEVYNYEAAGTGAAYRSTRGSYGMGILKTSDGGQTWSKSLDWSYNQQHGIWAIKIDPTNADILYAATTEGIYKSTDAGSNWQQVLDVVMGTDLLIHPDDSDKIVACFGNFASPGFGIYKSEDAGESWQQIISNLPTFYLGKIQLGLAPSNPDIIYASIGNGFGFDDGASWLCRSDDFGTNWTVRSTTDYSRWQGWFSHDVAVSPTDPDNIIAIGINVWRSYDGGNFLNQITEGGVGFSNPPIEGPDGNPDYVHSDAHDVIFHPTDPNKIYVANDGGIHRSDNGGDSWYSINGGYQTTQFYNGASTSQNSADFFIGGLQDNGTIRWNGDLTWTRVNGGDGSWTAIHPDTDDIFFVSSQNLNVRKTTNGGNSFFTLDWGASYLGPTAFIAPYVIAPSNGNIMYAGTSIMAKSTNEGQSWTPANGGNQLDGNPILSIEVSPQNPNVVYAGTAPTGGQRGNLFVSLNGSTFLNITGDLPDRYPMDITVDPTDPSVAYVVFSGFGTGHVFKTTNFGNSWEDISGNLPDVPTNAVIVDPILPDHVYIGNDIGVFVSTTGGTNWESYQNGLSTAVMVFDLKISMSNRKLRAATHGSGAFQRDLLDEVVSVEDLEEKTADFKIFPNPANEVARVQFENAKAQRVQLDILDINGKVIKRSYDEITNAGTQMLNLDVTNLPAGSYIVRLISGSGEQAQQLIVR
jgi:photosystem II stability/assembly factor-like uncharacterized protein